jgi:hypothetical protein
MFLIKAWWWLNELKHVACFILPYTLCTTDEKKNLHTAEHYSQVHRWLTSKCAPHSSTALWWMFLIPCHVSLQSLQSCVWTCWSSFHSSNIVCDGIVTQYMQLNQRHWWHSCSEIMIIFGFNVLVLVLSCGPYCRIWVIMFGTLVILWLLIQLHVSFKVQN